MSILVHFAVVMVDQQPEHPREQQPHSPRKEQSDCPGEEEPHSIKFRYTTSSNGKLLDLAIIEERQGDKPQSKSAGYSPF